MSREMPRPNFSRTQLIELFRMGKRSIDKNREELLYLTGSTERPRFENLCSGEACSVVGKLPKRAIGMVHTHPHTKPICNENDLATSSYEGLRYCCVVGNDDAPLVTMGGKESERASKKDLTLRCHYPREPPTAGRHRDLRMRLTERANEMKREKQWPSVLIQGYGTDRLRGPVIEAWPKSNTYTWEERQITTLDPFLKRSRR